MIKKLSIPYKNSEYVEKIINDFILENKINPKNIINIQRIFHVLEDEYELWYIIEGE